LPGEQSPLAGMLSAVANQVPKEQRIRSPYPNQLACNQLDVRPSRGSDLTPQGWGQKPHTSQHRTHVLTWVRLRLAQIKRKRSAGVPTRVLGGMRQHKLDRRRCGESTERRGLSSYPTNREAEVRRVVNQPVAIDPCSSCRVPQQDASGNCWQSEAGHALRPLYTPAVTCHFLGEGFGESSHSPFGGMVWRAARQGQAAAD
jgi:hypothetical protein